MQSVMAVHSNYLVATVHWWANYMKKKKEKEKEIHYLRLTGSLHYCILLSKEFLLFSTMPLSVETVMPVQTTIAVYLMIAFAVHALECMRTWLAFLGGCTICFFVVHATPCFFSVVFSSISSIALGTPRDMRMATECWMSPLPTILALQDIWVYIGIFDGSDETSYVEATIDDILYQRTTLGIPDVQPDYHHVWFRRCFDDMRFWGQYDTIEQVDFFKNTLNIIRGDDILIDFVWKSNDFYIQLGLWETQTFNWIWINILYVFEIFLNCW